MNFDLSSSDVFPSGLHKRSITSERNPAAASTDSLTDDSPSNVKMTRRKKPPRYEVMRNKMREMYNLDDTAKADIARDQEHAQKYDTSEVTSQSTDTDFFGLDDNVEMKGARLKNIGEYVKKHPYLVNKPLRSASKVYESRFGYLRFDGDNPNPRKPKQVGTSEAEIPYQEGEKYSNINCEQEGENTSSFIDDQYFATSMGQPVMAKQESGEPSSSQAVQYEHQIDQSISGTSLENDKFNDIRHTDNSKNAGMNTTGSAIFEEQYFGDIREQCAKSEVAVEEGSSSIHHSTNIFEEQYFDETPEGKSSNAGIESVIAVYNDPKLSDSDVVEEQFYHRQPSKASFESAEDKTTATVPDKKAKALLDSEKQVAGDSQHREHKELLDSQFNAEDIIVDKATKLEEKAKMWQSKQAEDHNSAYDAAIKIRQELKNKRKSEKPKVSENLHPKFQKWQGEVDSKGFRKLKSQVLDIQQLPEEVVLNILKDSVLYEDDNMVALYKPYGLPSHGGPGVHHSIGKMLPKLAGRLDKKLTDMYLVHRLDKETTGVMVVAKSEAYAWKLHEMFKRRKVLKKYWVLTKGIPNPAQGVIDIPMGETEVGSYYRMTLRPHYNVETKLYMTRANKVKKQEAVTNYKVLASNNSVALVECVPETGVKHQIRCHLAFSLNTPIIGDHKYSHISKIAPQRLFPEILQHLGIRQATVRYVPMHLHAKELVFPEIKDGRNLFLSARLPKHFMQNMKWLKIDMP